MKKIIFSIIALSLIAGSISGQKKIDIEKEKQAIKQVVLDQLDAIKAFNYDGEAAVWAQTPYIVRKDNVGWDSVSVYYQEMFKEWTDGSKPIKMEVLTASNFDIYVNGNFASVFHDEHSEYQQGGFTKIGEQRTHKYLEKIEGEWKIIALF